MTGTYHFEFKLYDDASGGSRVGSTVTKADVAVTDGLFTVALDFGSGAFSGDACYLLVPDQSWTTHNNHIDRNVEAQEAFPGR